MNESHPTNNTVEPETNSIGQEGANARRYTIAHISDLHCGSQHFVAHLMEQVINEINEIGPDLVVVTGDIADQGFRQEFRTARAFIDRLECADVLVVPGNHDARNVGYVHFEDFFGSRFRSVSKGPFHIVCIDSSEPDLDEGKVGREIYGWITESLTGAEGLRIVALHHHLIPIPGTGRERNIVTDAGDFLRLLVENCVNIVLSGHRHVPNVWSFEDMYLINAGTACTTRLRGYTKPCYNIISFDGHTLEVKRKTPFEGSEAILKTDRFAGLTCSVPVRSETSPAGNPEA